MADVLGERHHLRALARGSAVTLAGAGASTCAGFGLVLLVGRTTSSATAGSFFAATAVFVLAEAVAGLGTDTGLARFVLRDRAGRGVPALLRVAAIPVAVAALALTLGLSVLANDMRPLAWALPAAVGADFCLAVTRAYAVFRPTVVVDRLLRPTAQVATVAVVVALGGGAGPLAAAWAAPYAVAAVLAARSLRVVAEAHGAGRLLGGERVPAGTARQFWSFTWPRAIARVAQIVVQRADIVLVAWLLGPAQAALYTVATRFVVFGQLANQAVSSVVQPRFTAILVEEDRAALRTVFTVATSWSVLLAWPIYACVAAAPHGYLAWFGSGYVRGSSTAVTLTMAMSMLVAVASGPVDTLLLMAGRSGLSLANNLTAMVLDVGLCLLLIPRVGILGAAIAWGIAVTVRCVLGLAQVRVELGLWPDLPVLTMAALAPIGCVALPLAALDRAAGLGPVSWLAASAVAVGAYLGVAWLLRRPLSVDVFLEGVVRRRRHPVGVS